MNEHSQDGDLKLCTTSETEGFDLQSGQIWIYPTNYPLRDYQFNIIQQALLKNTLVSLPTGLGKTFIAAVVMYNFYRWYPHGKIIFMAPTRPLVKQQVDACYDIMGIPKEVTVEMTGTKISSTRVEIWNDKRVFFVTPQVLQNDLASVKDLGAKIKCIVFDEAHKARGNHAYCEVVRTLVNQNKYFRVLALSATPGSNINDVAEVANNLLISRLEFRTEESPDVHPYVFKRNIETVVVPLGPKLQEVKDRYLKVLDQYTKVLIKYKVIQTNCSTLTKGRIFMTMNDFKQKKGAGNPNYGEIMKSLNICMTLYHAFELLIRHGLRSFLTFFEEHINKPLLRGNQNIISIMEDLKVYLGPTPEVKQLPDGTYEDIPANVKFGHPKFYKLRDILTNHFKDAPSTSRVIVFFEYRESVMEAYALLFQAKPLLKPRIFLGQGYGVTQKVQMNVIKAFRDGQCNVLLSTCIGEEGLDVGDVDLIVCFDISNTSPIRMIQRMGRTGRKKEGNIFILVTEGKEQDTLKNCLIHKQNLASHVLTSKELNNSLRKDSPRMVPEGIVPRCEKMFITVKKPTLTKNSSIKDMLKSVSSGSGPVFSQDMEIVDFQEKLPTRKMLWNKEDPLHEDINLSTIFSRHVEKQRCIQPSYKIKSSKTSQCFVSLLQSADSKRFNIPMTQMSDEFHGSQNKIMKQGDIRNMFFKPTTKDQISNSQNSKKQNFGHHSSSENDITDIISREVFEEMSNYLCIQQSARRKCKLCPSCFDCNKINLPQPSMNLSLWNHPDLSILDNITTEDMDLFADSLSPKSKELYDSFSDVNFCESLSDIPEQDLQTEKSFSYVAPKSLNNLLNRYSTCIISQAELKETSNASKVPEKNVDCDITIVGQNNIQNISYHNINASIKNRTKETSNAPLKVLEINEDCDVTILEQNNKQNTSHNNINTSLENKTKLKDTIDTSDKFVQHNLVNKVSDINLEEILSFFKLSSLDEFYTCTDSSQDTIICSPESPVLSQRFKQKQKPPSPLLSSLSQRSSSPVLSNRSRLQLMKNKRLNKGASQPNPTRPNLSKLKSVGNQTKLSVDGTKSNISSVWKTNFSDENLKNSRISDIDICEKTTDTWNKQQETSVFGNLSEINDLCDLSEFGIESITSHISPKNVKNSTRSDGGQSPSGLNSNAENINSQLDEIAEMDFCDLSAFGISKQETNHKESDLSDDIIDISDDFLDNTVKKKSIRKELKVEADNKCTKTKSLRPDTKLTNSTPVSSTNKKIDFDTTSLDITKFNKNIGDKFSSKPEENHNLFKDSSLDDLCDLSIFGIKDSPGKVIVQSPKKSNLCTSPIISRASQNKIMNKSLTTNDTCENKADMSITQILSLVSKDATEDRNKQSVSKMMNFIEDNSFDDDLVFDFSSSRPVSQNKLGMKKNICSSINNLLNVSEKVKEASKTNVCDKSLKLNTSNLNESIVISSDEEFDMSVKDIKVNPRRVLRTRNEQNENEQRPEKKIKRKKRGNCFIDGEAELSDDDVFVSDDEDDGSDQDSYEKSFVEDNSENIIFNTQIHANYLQSIKSPVRPGPYKIPTLPRYNISDVFSQYVDLENDTYMHDSFCVNTEDVDDEVERDISQLEILEKKLKEKNKNKKRKISQQKKDLPKRKRILVMSDDSD